MTVAESNMLNLTKMPLFFLSAERCQILALCIWVCYDLHIILGIHMYDIDMGTDYE